MRQGESKETPVSRHEHPITHRQRAASRRRAGFTLLELLTVIGVMLVLMAIAIIGYTHVSRSTAIKSTSVDLENAKSFLAEYEQSMPLSTLPAPPSSALTRNALNAFDVTPDFGSQPQTGSNDRYGQAVKYTIEIMGQLVRFPHNKQVIAQLPAKKLLTYVDGTTLAIPAPAGMPKFPAPPQPQYCLLDAWGNPIIYVPASGLNVMINNAPSNAYGGQGEGKQYIVRSSGIYPATQLPPLGAKDRPFWASAGPDGNFQNGDDNMYSFQN